MEEVKLNIENFKRLRDFIAKPMPGVSFDMSDWIQTQKYNIHVPRVGQLPALMLEGSCKTAGCIAGNAAILLAADSLLRDEFHNKAVNDAAREWLGLTHRQANYLFTPWDFSLDGVEAYQITKKAALYMLDRIIKYGRLPTDKKWWKKSVVAVKGKPYK